MIINIKTKQIDLTPVLEEHVQKKLSILKKLLGSFEEKGSLSVDFELARTTKHHRKGDVYYAEANVKLGGDMIRANHDAEDIYKAIDMVKSTLQREIRKYKTKKA